MKNLIGAEQNISKTYKAVSIISRKYCAQFWDFFVASEGTLKEVKDLQSVFLYLHFADKNIEVLRLLRMFYEMLEKPYPDELNIIEKHPFTAGLFMNEFLLYSGSCLTDEHNNN